MESGLPLLHCLLQHTLRNLCSSSTSTSDSSSSSSSKWVYAVFWRIVPRNFPPPRWEFGGSALDRSKGNKRNWILVWEDGFCDFNECQHGRSLNERFGAEVFFKMSHEVYNFGEGLLGKVAADNSHKWVYGDTQNGCESDYVGTWNSSSDHQPRAWEFQFNSGIQTVAVIGVREGLVQLGSFNKIAEDLNIVMSIQRKFSYLQSIPGVFAIQRPSYLPIQQQNPYIAKSNFQIMDSNNDMPLSNYNMVINQIGSTNNNNSSSRILEEKSNYFSMVAINMMGRNNNNNNNSLQDGTQQGSMQQQSLWSGPSTLPNMSCSLGALLSRLPNEVPSCFNPNSQVLETNNRMIINTTTQRVKIEDSGFHLGGDADHKENARS
ncbi:hypothetical protein HN51_042329 [Arachis hypogaea]|uniref:Transcription factor MYC/MYB N-terminal domain-containing protein n=1 Tax=Arachis hypogaea TaxID=3818 RepID=A0A444YWC3_ARAHY|nr:uncharacterized protein DS421_16g561850 [Arachis hypogaea]RYR06196.1 hypothetical protein Ahy_B06g085983 [Arachis hypogaea]